MKRIKTQIGIGLVSGFLNGLFGAGGGSIVVPAMEIFLKMEEKKAHATAIGVILVLSAVSALFYIRHGFFDLDLWGYVTVGGMIGGAVGAKLLGRIPKDWLKILFGGMMMLTAIKMIF